MNLTTDFVTEGCSETDVFSQMINETFWLVLLLRDKTSFFTLYYELTILSRLKFDRFLSNTIVDKLCVYFQSLLFNHLATLC